MVGFTHLCDTFCRLNETAMSEIWSDCLGVTGTVASHNYWICNGNIYNDNDKNNHNDNDNNDNIPVALVGTLPTWKKKKTQPL